MNNLKTQAYFQELEKQIRINYKIAEEARSKGLDPKNKVEIVDYSAKYETVVEICEKTGCTRFPVLKEEEVVGLINIKDLLKYYGKEKSFKVSKILRPIIFAPESMKLFSLQEKLKKNRVHMAAIVNEHGDFTGIVTFEDIIEELLGDINDEYDSTSEKSENIKETLDKFLA